MSVQKTQIKNQLFSSMKELGLQQQLKKHIRIQLCEKLKEKDLIKKQQSHQDKLYNRIMTSMISEELKMTDCGYSNSIYVAESGYDMKTLQRKEIIEILGMNEEDLDPQYSVLSNLMKRKYPFNGNTLRTISIQTNPQEVGYTLQQRLALIDQQYRKNITNNVNNKDEIDYKRKLQQLELDLRRTYERDLDRFKEFEAHSIKVKVSQQWRKKFEDYVKNLSQEYRRKMQNLRKKQKLLSDDIVNRNKVLDQKINVNHKTLIQKVDLIDIKNSTIQELKKNLQIQRKRAQQQYDNREKQLKNKIRQYDGLLLKLKDQIDYEVGVAKLAIQQQYQEKNAQFLARKKFVDEEYGKLMGIKDTTDVIKEENKRLFEENMRLRKDLTELEQQLRISVSESASKGERLQSLRAQINKLEKQRNNKQEGLKQQIKKCKKKQDQIIELRKQLDELREFKQKAKEKERQKDEQQPRLPPQSISSQPKSDIAIKIQSLRQERMKQIQRLKLQL